MAIRQGQARPRRAPPHRVGVKRESSSHKTLMRPGWPDVVFASHDKDEIGPKMLARIAKNTGLKPEDL